MSDAFNADRWRVELEEKRAEKDEFFAEHDQSPIPPDQREGFDGLEYFSPDADYRVTATVEVHDDPDPVSMDTTADREMRYLRAATLEFDLERSGADRSSKNGRNEKRGPSDRSSGTRFEAEREPRSDGTRSERREDLENAICELAGYRQEGARERSLFVPFRDKTTGQQTYRGGRYMELEPARSLETGDGIVLDFNLAYSPFCAYSETFDCPLPPEENWLDVAIPAGEKFE